MAWIFGKKIKHAKSDYGSSYKSNDEEQCSIKSATPSYKSNSSTRSAIPSYKSSSSTKIVTHIYKSGFSTKSATPTYRSGSSTKSVTPSYKSNSNIKSATRQNQILCVVCHKHLINSYGSDYVKNEFWNQFFCKGHFYDNTPMCCGCMRMKPKDINYVHLGDGRHICPDCYSTSILDAMKCESVSFECRKFFKGLGMEIPEELPIYLVDKLEMRRLTSGTRRPIGVKTKIMIEPENPNTMIYGLTMFGLEQEIMHVTNSSRRGNSIEVTKEVRRHGRDEITIAVLFGLPRIVFREIVAHEMMHAWLRFQGVSGLELKVEEGICQVMAYKWLERYESKEISSSSKATESGHFARNLIQYVKNHIETIPSYVYREGFREAHWAVTKHGLAKTIDYIVQYRKLPQ